MAAQDKETLTGAPPTPNKPPKKLLLVSLLAFLLLMAAIIAIVTGVNAHIDKTPKKSNTNLILSPTSHAVLKSSCSSTRFPDLCFSAIASSVPGAQLATQKDVIELSLNLTIRAVEENFFTVEKLIKSKSKTLTKRETTALHDCLETIDDTLDELRKTCEDLKAYPNKKTVSHHANDLKTQISAAMTNPDTCIDGFSHEEADVHVRAALLKGQEHVERMCSNALAMVKNMTDGDIAKEEMLSRSGNVKNRRLNEWPEWFSVADRRLLQASTVSADTVVAADGSGDHKTVAAAVAAAPIKSSKRYVIRIKAGTYNENVDVTKNKTNIMFMGDGRNITIIRASRNVVDGSTTFNSATIAVMGHGFLARDITFQNTAGPSKHQAVALRVGSDLSAFYQCDILGYQDTLYVHSNRQIFVNCLITGTVDFIFGNAAVVFQDCDIHARRPDPGQKNMVTAQGRTDPNQNTGIVIQKCRIGATTDLEPVTASFPTYLGRPWKEYSRTVVMQSIISDVISPTGWHEWNQTFALNTSFYGEYGNTGSGADTSKRVDWKGFRVINSSEAESFSPSKFIAGNSWLGSTSFPYSLGL